MPPAKVSDQQILAYFRDLPVRFGKAYDATNFRSLIKDEPFKTMLADGDIVSQNLTNALLRQVKRGYLERRGVKKGSVYRISEKGRTYLKTLASE